MSCPYNQRRAHLRSDNAYFVNYLELYGVK